MPLIDEMVHNLWLREAERGNPPDPVEVFTLQYGRDAPWHLRQHFLKHVRSVGKAKAKQLVCREVTRGGGKTIVVCFMVLYLAEYVIPFLKQAKPENKRLLLIGRTETHIVSQNMKVIEEMICHHAPWLKTREKQYWSNPEALMDYKIRQRTWHKTIMDLTNGISLRGFGWDQSVRGEHVFGAFVDDPIDENNCQFGDAQLKVIQGAIQKAIEPGGLLFVDSTPQADNDLPDLIRQDGNWDYARLPVLDNEGKLGYKKMNLLDLESGRLAKESITIDRDLDCLWPARMDHAWCEAERGKTRESEIRFQQECMLERIVDNTLLVHPNHFVASLDRTLCYAQSMDEGQAYFGVDPSTLKVDGAGIIGGSVEAKAVRRLLYLNWIEPGQNPMVVFDELVSVYDRFKKPRFLIEQNGYQGMLKPFLEKERADIRVETKMLTGNKSTSDGYLLVRAIFAAGKARLPYGPTEQEKILFKEGKITESDFDAVKRTDKLRIQLSGVRVIDGKVVEDPKKPNDLVAAIYYFFKATDGITHTPEVKVVQIPTTTPLSPPIYRDVERGGRLYKRSALDRVSLANKLEKGRRRFL